jgi:hypothetical protein
MQPGECKPNNKNLYAFLQRVATVRMEADRRWNAT